MAKTDCEVEKNNHNDQTDEVLQATIQPNFVSQHQLQFAKFQGPIDQQNFNSLNRSSLRTEAGPCEVV
ncbi:hypothetical protein DU508_01720 [Pedobacter chinensis]|uniref:Uncharacterized protein n=1 Tax=Pedobacter chinensis TaxID=2282421 RepID=A0A369PYZ7_9SPHI|nr:hypothetical protein DU508_01720 [Pedobacter chinensis]